MPQGDDLLIEQQHLSRWRTLLVPAESQKQTLNPYSPEVSGSSAINRPAHYDDIVVGISRHVEGIGWSDLVRHVAWSDDVKLTLIYKIG